MKRFLKIFFGVFGGLFLLLLILPFAFKGKIEAKVKDVINENINATVSWDKFSLSLIRNFPNLGIGLNGLTIINDAPFEGDTLLYIGRFSASADVMSAIKGDAIDIRSVLLDNVKANLKVNADSVANWDIVPVSEEEEVVVEEESSSAFNILLRSFEIRNTSLSYADATSALVTTIDGFNSQMTGDLSADYTTISIKSGIEALNLTMDGIKFINNAVVDLRANIGADLENMVFKFEENELNFSGIPLFFEGMVAMVEEGIDMDVRLAATDTEFKTLLALVPDEYMKDFEGLRTSGNMAFNAVARGLFVSADTLPSFNLALQVKDGFVQYPDLPKSINGISIDFLVDNPGGSADNTVLDVKDFRFTIDNNPFGGTFRLITPVSNATFNGEVKGTINFASLMDAIPLDSIDLKGIMKADLSFAGDYNMIEAEKYEEIKANGLVGLTNFEFSSPDLPMGVLIPEAGMNFSPRYVELSSFLCKIGESDFSLKGRLENYLAYVLSDGTLKGKLQHSSEFINTNELMALAGEEEELPEDTVAVTGKVLIPDNIDFDMTTNINKLVYDKLTVESVKGNLLVKDARVLLKDVSTNLLNGAMKLKGEYNTQDTLKPFVNMDLTLDKIDVNKAANSFSIVESMLPIAQKATGRISTSFNFSSVLGDGFSPVISSLNGGGLLKSDELSLSGAKVQQALVTMLKDEKYAIANAKDFLLNFSIDNGNLFVKPFDVTVFDKKVNFAGRQGLDQSMDYIIKMPVSRKELSNIAGLLGIKGNLPDGDDVLVGIKIGGTLTDPQLSFNSDDIAAALKSELKKEAEKAATKAVEKVGEQVAKEAEKAVNDLIQDEETKEKIQEAGQKLKDLFKRE